MSNVDKKTSFDFFWDNVIATVKTKADKEMDPAFKKECDVKVKDDAFYKETLLTIYKEKREWLKSVYMPHEKAPMLDFHKIGAVLCRSIIKNKPFMFDVQKAETYVRNKFKDSQEDNTDWFVDNLYVNYKVAFYVSIGVIFLQLEKDLIVNGKFDSLSKLNNRGTIYFYESTDRHENFENSSILALMKNDILTRKFDYLTYAIMLFQLEEYNKIIINQEE